MSTRVAEDSVAQERWKPSTLIVASMGLHGLAGAGLLLGAEAWPWAISAVAANHLFLGAIGMWPRSTWLGANLTRLPDAAIARHEIALTFDDGPDPDITPRDAAGPSACGLAGPYRLGDRPRVQPARFTDRHRRRR